MACMYACVVSLSVYVSTNLGFSGQNPVKKAFYVGFDVFGILAPGDDCNTALHIPLQANLQSKVKK